MSMSYYSVIDQIQNVLQFTEIQDIYILDDLDGAVRIDIRGRRPPKDVENEE